MSTKEVVKEQGETGLALKARGYGNIRDYKSGSATVIWQGMPKGMFRLKKDDKEIVLSKYDLLYLLRNV